MGATKNKAIEFAEEMAQSEDYAVFSQVLQREEYSPMQTVISGLKQRMLPMSYSKLKHLDSPVNFINNLLKPLERNTAMTFGSVVDCLLLEPHKFDKKFAIVSETPTTENQKTFVNYFLNETSPLEAYDDRFEQALKASYKNDGRRYVKGLHDYLNAMESGKDVISQQIYEKAKEVSDNLANAPEVADELAVCDSFQKFIEFTYQGWTFRGILDTYSPEVLHDLKFSNDCNPENFGRSIDKFGYDVQFGLYLIGLEILGLADNPKFKYILFDDKFNYSVLEVGEDYLNYGKRKVENYVKRLNKMVDEDAFRRSYDYFKSKNVIHKPRWIAGLDEEIFND